MCHVGATFVPWREVRVELPEAVYRQLERQAKDHGVSVGFIICAIVVANQSRGGDALGGTK